MIFDFHHVLNCTVESDIVQRRAPVQLLQNAKFMSVVPSADLMFISGPYLGSQSDDI